ncbi:MAG: hypothetical protein R6V58_05640, partial [Planctomycetota bacterium]
EPRVFYRIVMKVCGWNVLRAAGTEPMRRRVAERTARSPLGGILRSLRRVFARSNRFRLPLGWRVSDRRAICAFTGPTPHHLAA